MEEDIEGGQRKAFTRPVAENIGHLSIGLENSCPLPRGGYKKKHLRGGASGDNLRTTTVKLGLRWAPKGAGPD